MGFPEGGKPDGEPLHHERGLRQLLRLPRPSLLGVALLTSGLRREQGFAGARYRPRSAARGVRRRRRGPRAGGARRQGAPRAPGGDVAPLSPAHRPGSDFAGRGRPVLRVHGDGSEKLQRKLKGFGLQAAHLPLLGLGFEFVGRRRVAPRPRFRSRGRGEARRGEIIRKGQRRRSGSDGRRRRRRRRRRNRRRRQEGRSGRGRGRRRRRGCRSCRGSVQEDLFLS